jgi:uncharacterized membrane protein HdeD (DUF308 family)
MATNFPFFLSDLPGEITTLRRNWGWLVGLGLVMCVVGVVAIGSPVWATITTVEVFGILLIISGAIEIVGAFRVGRSGSFVVHLLCGLLSMFLGVVLLDRPLLGAAFWTLVLAVYFVAAGLFRVIFALTHDFSGWGWVLFLGAVDLLLGVLIWKSLPDAALWVIGTFIGIDLIFNGMTWLMLGLALRSAPALEPPASAPPTAPPTEPAGAQT